MLYILKQILRNAIEDMLQFVILENKLTCIVYQQYLV